MKTTKSKKTKMMPILLLAISALMMTVFISCAKEKGCDIVASQKDCEKRCVKGRIVAKYEYQPMTGQCCCTN